MSVETKTCIGCQQDLPRSEFHKQIKRYDSKHHNVPADKHGQAYGDDRQPRCKTCRNADRRAKRNDPKVKRRRKNAWLKSNFGITIEDYEVMLESQSGRCAICECLPCDSYKGVLCVDHDHKTGQVRGLLCSACNCGIGYLKDSYKLCELATQYLKDHT